MGKLFLILYNIIFVLILPILFLSLIFKGFKNREYLKRWNERMGLIKDLKDGKRVWLHALSLGEVNASIPLIKKIMETFQDYKILITTTTPTGSAQVKKTFGDSVEHVYLPYDFKPFISNFLKRAKPSVGLIIETEIWPNLIYSSYINDLPLILVNARLSERSMKRYLLLGGLVSCFLNKFRAIAVRDASDFSRFKKLGVKEGNLRVIGNIKFDLNIDEGIYKRSQELKKLFEGKMVFTAGSTHGGEEEILLEAFTRLVKEYNNLVLIIAPRDPKRGKDVLKIVEKYSMKGVLRNDLKMDECFDHNVLIVNTLGELLMFYVVSDVAFVGGSLVPKGGHNPLEPLALRVPTIAGSFTYNFSDLYKILADEKIVYVVNGVDDIYSVVRCLLVDNDLRKEIINKGVNFIQKNRGSIDRVINMLRELSL